MGTSRSTDDERAWTAGASVFSGRPDPRWPLPTDAAQRLAALWDALDPLRGEVPDPPPLGYRGCFVADPDGTRRLDAFRGAVTSRANDAVEVRDDPTRAFERFVLGSSPDPFLRDRLLALAALTPP